MNTIEIYDQSQALKNKILLKLGLPENYDFLKTGIRNNLRLEDCNIDELMFALSECKQLYILALREKQRNELMANELEKRIENANDSICDFQIQKMSAKEKQDALEAGIAAKNSKSNLFNVDITKLNKEIADLNRQIEAATARQNTRNILFCIPIINIFAAIESLCSDDIPMLNMSVKEKIEKEEEIKKELKELDCLRGELNKAMKASAELTNTINYYMAAAKEMHVNLLENKVQLVAWIKLAQTFGNLAIFSEHESLGLEEMINIVELLGKSVVNEYKIA